MGAKKPPNGIGSNGLDSVPKMEQWQEGREVIIPETEAAEIAGLGEFAEFSEIAEESVPLTPRWPETFAGRAPQPHLLAAARSCEN